MSLLDSGWWSILLLSDTFITFTGKISSLMHFLLEPGCEDYSFLDQAIVDFEQGLDSILTNSCQDTRIGSII